MFIMFSIEACARRRLFYKPRDYEAFEEIVEETLLTRPMRICGFCLMPNHWHLFSGLNTMGSLLLSCNDSRSRM